MYESSNLRASLSSVALCLSAPRASSAAARPPPSLCSCAQLFQAGTSTSSRPSPSAAFLAAVYFSARFESSFFIVARRRERSCDPACHASRGLGVYAAFPWKTTISSGARSAPKALLHFPLL
ncbi:hypothetical protein HPB50_010689 [Hyalomma asiaticum]|uniref:Uncharacterized protein n=1 Tax=Hyalomma asiaticum TaxID=266040 RepID=A0ACB7SDI4_HYAAI|nr:hypothetical protein HPB50_010689 [Hyalomma asiaticum]